MIIFSPTSVFFRRPAADEADGRESFPQSRAASSDAARFFAFFRNDPDI